MKKKIMTVFIGVILLAIVCNLSYWSFVKRQADNKYSLFLENVETLSQSEGSPGVISECAGPAVYDRIETGQGEKTVRIHFCDSVDVVTVYSIKSCNASGIGKTQGSNYYYPDGIKSQNYAKCLGELYHNQL